MKDYYESEITSISQRLTDFIIYFNPLKKKDDLVKLLEKLIKLHNEIQKDFGGYRKTDKNIQIDKDFMKETIRTAKCIGEIIILKKTISSILEKIADIEKENKLTKEDQEVIEESKKDDGDKSYFG